MVVTCPECEQKMRLNAEVTAGKRIKCPKCETLFRAPGEVRVGGEEILDAAVKVCEIAASTAGDENFLSQAVGAFEHGHATAALAGFDGAHQACCASAEDECIEGVGHESKRRLRG